MLSLPLTNAKHVWSDANAFEQSTLLPVGPDAATGAGVAAVGAATGAGVAVVGAATGTGVAVGVAAAGAGTDTEGAAATGDGTATVGAATGAVVGGGATGAIVGAVTGGVAMVGAMVGGAGGLVPDFGAGAGASATTKEPHWMLHKSNATNTVARVAPCIILIAIFDHNLPQRCRDSICRLQNPAPRIRLASWLPLKPGPPDSKTRAYLASFQFPSRTSPRREAASRKCIAQ